MTTSPDRSAQRASGTARGSWRALISRVGAIVRRIIGAPDYETYLASMAKHHPQCMPLDARSFERDRLAARYRGPGSRCC